MRAKKSISKLSKNLNESQILAQCLSSASFSLPGTSVNSAWIEHTPFALWLVETMRPKHFVELGTLHGVSYFTFCQAIARLGLTARACAVDTWGGDEHTGFYGDEVFDHVKLENAKYTSFSSLVRKTFDAAVEQFSDGSIDLLHIDGRHFYEDVHHDFLTYLPKLSDSAIVLFHDTNVHERDFGVARLWKELTLQYPSFEFLHGHGLGVLRIGKNACAELDGLFSAEQNPATRTLVRNAYARLGSAVSQHLALRHEESLTARLRSDLATIHSSLTAAEAKIEVLHSNVFARDANRIRHQDQFDRKNAAAIVSESALGSANAGLELFHNKFSNLEREQSEYSVRLKDFETLGIEHSRGSAELQMHHRKVPVESGNLLTALPRYAAELFKAIIVLMGRDKPLSKSIRRLSKAGIFDSEWYLAEYPDVAASGTDALRHFVAYGASEGRSASALFNTREYLVRNPDVARSGVNPLLHYFELGAKEGRVLGTDFDAIWYNREYMDVAKSGQNPLAHYLLHGRKEGRHPVPPIGTPAYSQTMKSAGSACRFEYEPLISVITPVYNIAPKWLHAAVASVRLQSYVNWELCICDDGSSNQETINALAEIEGSDSRIQVVRNVKNQGIANATNAALAIAKGDFVAFLDNDDELVPEALEICVKEINNHATIDILYSDEDKIAANGSYEEPFYKPDWSPHLLREVMYIGHLLVVRRSLIEQNGGLDARYDGVQDFELALRLSEKARTIHHIRRILYHWRRIPGSVADKSDAKPGLGRLQAAAVNAHLSRIGIKANAAENPRLQHRAVLQPHVRTTWPRVSIVIPTKDAPHYIGRCLGSIFEHTTYLDYEVVVVDNGSTNKKALAAIACHPVKLVQYNEPFNYSRANNMGVQAATGEIIVLLNNDTEVVQTDWLEQLLFFIEDSKVSVVGPRLLYPNGTVQHAGVALGMRGTADHVLRGLPADADGYFGSLVCSREVSAVTFACAMMRRADYIAAGGLEELFASHYQDVDLCMRLRSEGTKVIFTPRATLVHHESATRGSKYDSLDRLLLLDRWGSLIAAGDPYSRWEPEARIEKLSA